MASSEAEAAVKTEDKAVSSALQGVEVERIVGPGNESFVKLGSLWQDQPVVIHLLRRFGCRLCRGGAEEMSRAIPHLHKAGVRVVGVGLEPFGLDEFVQGKYWAGELYVDEGKKAFKALELKSLSYLHFFYQVFTNPDLKRSLEQTKNVEGNLAGDGMQLGATMAFDKGGALLFSFKQKTPGDHPSPEELLGVFKIDPSVLQNQPTNEKTSDPSCQHEECS